MSRSVSQSINKISQHPTLPGTVLGAVLTAGYKPQSTQPINHSKFLALWSLKMKNNMHLVLASIKKQYKAGAGDRDCPM